MHDNGFAEDRRAVRGPGTQEVLARRDARPRLVLSVPDDGCPARRHLPFLPLPNDSTVHANDQ